MTAWDIKTAIVGICVAASFFLAPLAYAGDEKATTGKGVESTTIDQLRADEHELTLKIQGCQWQIDRYTKEARAIAKEQAEYSKSLEAVKEEIAEREAVKKGEKKSK